jgi:hypothetical protein
LAAEGDAHTVDYPLESGTACPAAAGDVLFFNYLTIHGSGVNRSSRTRRNVLFQYRDPADVPVLNGDGVEDHVDWGMGLMVAGSNPGFWGWRPRFRIRQDELVEPAGVYEGGRGPLTARAECGYVATAGRSLLIHSWRVH